MPSYHIHEASWRVREQKVDVNSPGLMLVGSFQPSVPCFPLFLPKSSVNWNVKCLKIQRTFVWVS